MVLAIRTRKDTGSTIKGLLKLDHIYNDTYLPKKQNEFIFFPLKEHPKELLIKLKETDPGVFVTDIAMRKNNRTRSFRRALEDVLPPDVYADASYAYEQIGEVAIITITKSSIPYEQEIAQTLLDTNAGIRTVVKKTGTHSGEDRLQEYVLLAGEADTHTVHTESGVAFELDIADVYFSARTFEERRRIVSEVRSGERVLVGFSGIGPYVLQIAKHTQAQEVVGVEQNDAAHQYAVANAKRNGLTDNTTFVHGYLKKQVQHLAGEFDRIVLPHPTAADEFISDVLSVAANKVVLHVYLFSKHTHVSVAQERLESLVYEAGFVASDVHVEDLLHVSSDVHKYCFDITCHKRS